MPERPSRGIDRYRGPVRADQNNQGSDAQARGGAARGPEPESGGKSEPEREAEQDRQPRPLVGAPVRIVVVADCVQPGGQVVVELPPGCRAEQARRYAERPGSGRDGEKRRNEGRKPGPAGPDGAPG